MLIGVGGEARVYALPQSPSLVAKVYHQPAELRARKLAAMLANPPHDPMSGSGLTSIAWPVDLLLPVEARKQPLVAGFLMPRINRMKPIIDFYHPRTRRRACPLFSYFYLHRAGRNLAAAVRSLHEGGYVIGDLNESNILVSDTALVALVDTDSFQVRDAHSGEVYRCAVGKAEFTPPELQRVTFAEMDREPAHDLFGLAVILFQLLMEGTHPFAGQFTGRGEPPPVETRISSGHFPHSLNKVAQQVPYKPMPAAPPFDVLSPRLRELFVQCFNDGHRDPLARPDAQTWAQALKEAEDTLLTCAANSQHRYGAHLMACPWCERTKQLGGRDPFPSTQAVRKGQHLAPAPKKPRPQPRPVAAQPYVVVQRPVSTHTTPAPAVRQTGRFTNWLQTITSGGLSGGRLLWILWVMFMGVRACANFSPTTETGKPFIPETLPPSPSISALHARLAGHTDAVESVAFSPDGQMVASSGRDAKIMIWSVPDKKWIKTLQGQESNVTAIAFAPKSAPDGYDLASSSSDRSLALWRLDSRKMKELSPLDGNGITTIAFSRDGRLLATGNSDSTVRLWNVASGTLLREFNDHYWGLVSVAFSDDGKTLASGSGDGLIKFREVQTGKVKKILTIDVAANQPRRSGSGQSPFVTAMAFSPNLNLIAAGWYNKTLRLLDGKTGEIKRTFSTKQDIPLSLVFSANSSVLASGHSNGHVVRWSVAGGFVLQDLDASNEAINSIALSPDGEYLVSGGMDKEVRIWKTQTTFGGPLPVVPPLPPKPISTPRFQ